jgi:ATP-dependent Zn protease
MDEAKQELVEVIDFLKEPQRFNEIGSKMPIGYYSSDLRGPVN